MEMLTGFAIRAAAGDVSVAAPPSSVTGAPSGVSRASTTAVPTPDSTGTRRSTVVSPSLATVISTLTSDAGIAYEPRSSVVSVRSLTRTIASGRGRPVSSAIAWPTRTPSAMTRSDRVAVAVLPARSTAVAVTTSDAPTASDSGAVRSTATCPCVNVPSVTPFAVTTTRSSPTLSLAVMPACAPRRREIVSGAAMSIDGGVESRVTMTSAPPTRSSASVATTCRWFSPSASGTAAENTPAWTAAVTAPTFTLTRLTSATRPLTVMLLAEVSASGAGASMTTAGAAVSSRMLRTAVA